MLSTDVSAGAVSGIVGEMKGIKDGVVTVVALANRLPTKTLFATR